MSGSKSYKQMKGFKKHKKKSAKVHGNIAVKYKCLPNLKLQDYNIPDPPKFTNAIAYTKTTVWIAMMIEYDL